MAGFAREPATGPRRSAAPARAFVPASFMSHVPEGMVQVRLRVAVTADERAAAIEDWLRAGATGLRRAVIAEGALFDRPDPPSVPLVGLPSGCPCCTGLLTLRVTLVRTMRRWRPESMLLLLTASEHLPRLRRMLEDGELGVRFEVEG
jgi:hypothetical protein